MEVIRTQPQQSTNSKIEEENCKMTKITITIEGSTEELKDAMSKLINLAPTGTLPQETDPQPSSEFAPIEGDHWTDPLIKELWYRVSPKTRIILGEMARNPEGITSIQIQQLLDVKPKGIGGIMSSVYDAIKYLQKKYDANLDAHGPYDTPTSEFPYRLKRSFRPIILELDKDNRPT
jgi:hypothetical protein